MVRKQPSTDPALLAEEAYRSALAHIERGEKENAEHELTRAHELQPEHAGVIAALATLYLQQAQPEKAAALLVSALAAEPDDANLRLLLARTRMAAGRANEAWQLLRERVPVLAGHTDYHAVLAALEQQLGHSAEAAVRYNALLAIDSTQGAWWLGLGLALESQQRRAEASNAYRRALMQANLPAAARDYATARIAALGDR
jgi:MSHA biogenesis protein MshN